MRGEISSGRHAKRQPYDWYVEPDWTTAQLIQALGRFQAERDRGLAIWDPACGRGNIPILFDDNTFRTYLSDVVDRVAWADFAIWHGMARPIFTLRDFREFSVAPAPCSIVCNPPYSYIKGIAEAFARHALALATRRVCMLVPVKWLSSQVRFRLFMIDHPPLAVLHLCQRPSMPPGDMIEAMGTRAFNGGMVDYCWVVWDKTRPTLPGQTRTIWLPPLGQQVDPIEGIA